MAEPEPGGEHGHHHQHDHGGPDSPLSAIRNLRGTGLPWRKVLAIAASNMRRKIVTMRGCCGHPGQPGC